MTIRRDLALLAEKGLLTRQYGKAISLETAENVRRENNDIQKYRQGIGAYAAGLVCDGDAIFINGSQTALGLLSFIGEKQVRVNTNNGWAIEREYPENVKIHLIGGELYRHVMIGEYVVQNLFHMTANKTFLGCAAVYDDGEFRYDIPTEIGINEIMIAKTSEDLYVLADHTKLLKRVDQTNIYGSCRYAHPVTLITDDAADPEIVSNLELAGIRVIRVPSWED